MDLSDISVSLEPIPRQPLDSSVYQFDEALPEIMINEISDSETRIFRIIKLLDR